MLKLNRSEESSIGLTAEMSAAIGDGLMMRTGGYRASWVRAYAGGHVVFN